MTLTLALLMGCTGPSNDGTVDEATTETGLITDSVPHGDTSDTASPWPPGLVGEPVLEEVEPLAVFSAENLSGLERRPSDLYDGTPTLLVYLSTEDQSSVDAADSLFLGLPVLNAAGITYVGLTVMPLATTLAWADDNNYTTLLEIWADPDQEIVGYYEEHAQVPSAPSGLLFDEDGVLVLIYQRVDTLDDFTQDVANDAALLWGAR